MNFCTLFDSYYIYKGLALYRSLLKNCSDFHLYIMAFDIVCYEKLKNLGLDNVTIKYIGDFETKELISLKEQRTKAEYCWTCGPTIIEYFIETFSLNDCTYLDADLMFIASPQLIFDEFDSSVSVAISEHFHNEIIGGKYCVQFMYFKNDLEGMKCLKWWKDRCIEWCYARYEDGKYGDQKYLDSFPQLFENVYVIKNRGAGIAPWNMNLYIYDDEGKNVIFNNNKYPCVFFHFHGIRVAHNSDELLLKAVTYDVSPQIEHLFFLPYLNLLLEVLRIYFNKELTSVRIEKRMLWERIYSYIKQKCKYSKVMQFLYYKVFKMRYEGYEYINK